jgi:hypothetical protein
MLTTFGKQIDLNFNGRLASFCPEAAVVLDDSTKDGEDLMLYRGSTQE